jgi:LmbE family N-acetylglucosaminyl deacetylase
MPNIKIDYRKKNYKKTKSVAVIVAHPDDETLWAGGTIFSNPSWKCFIACLCRASDMDRAQRFNNALKAFKSDGIMGDIEDGPEQKPINENELETAILDLLPAWHFDLIISHSPIGEYTRHIRHEEVGKAVINLWHTGKISTSGLWTFAYEDGDKKYYPRPIENASIIQTFSAKIWQRKYNLITKTYGFEKNSFEAETTPKSESFMQFTDPNQAKKWFVQFSFLKII